MNYIFLITGIAIGFVIGFLIGMFSILWGIDDDTEIAFTRLHDSYFVQVIKWVKNIPYIRKVMVYKEDFGFIDEILREELGVEILGEEE